jgi:biotin-(acetyl-CoA carboxylase) ligase
MSLLFRPPEPFAHFAARVTMLCGLALVEAVETVGGLAAPSSGRTT